MTPRGRLPSPLLITYGLTLALFSSLAFLYSWHCFQSEKNLWQLTFDTDPQTWMTYYLNQLLPDVLYDATITIDSEYSRPVIRLYSWVLAQVPPTLREWMKVIFVLNFGIKILLLLGFTSFFWLRREFQNIPFLIGVCVPVALTVPALGSLAPHGGGLIPHDLGRLVYIGALLAYLGQGGILGLLIALGLSVPAYLIHPNFGVSLLTCIACAEFLTHGIQRVPKPWLTFPGLVLIFVALAASSGHLRSFRTMVQSPEQALNAAVPPGNPISRRVTVPDWVRETTSSKDPPEPVQRDPRDILQWKALATIAFILLVMRKRSRRAFRQTAGKGLNWSDPFYLKSAGILGTALAVQTIQSVGMRDTSPFYLVGRIFRVLFSSNIDPLGLMVFTLILFGLGAQAWIRISNARNAGFPRQYHMGLCVVLMGVFFVDLRTYPDYRAMPQDVKNTIEIYRANLKLETTAYLIFPPAPISDSARALSLLLQRKLYFSRREEQALRFPQVRGGFLPRFERISALYRFQEDQEAAHTALQEIVQEVGPRLYLYWPFDTLPKWAKWPLIVPFKSGGGLYSAG